MPRFAFGDFQFDTDAFQLRRGDRRVPVEPKGLDVLRVLLERAPRMVEKRELFAVAWKDVAVADNALTRVIAHLRRALEDDSQAPRYIATVATRGYRFLAPVAVLTPPGPSEVTPVVWPTERVWGSEPVGGPAEGTLQSQPATEADLRPPSDSRTRRRWVGAALALSVLVGGGFRAWPWVARGLSARQPRLSIASPDVATLAALTPQRMTSGRGFEGFLTFSPDGNSYAFSSDRTGALEVYVQGLAEGSTPLALTSNGRHNVQPAWSPDGQFIAYHEMAGEGIWIVPSRGGTARKLSDFGAYPSWSPDGRSLAFQSAAVADLMSAGGYGGFSTIWLVAAEGREPPVRLTSPSRPKGSHSVPRWWPDGRRIVFALAPRTGPPRSELWSVEVHGGRLQRLSAHPRLTAEFAVAPDGDGLLFSARGSHAVWWLPWSDTGEDAGEPRPTGLPVTGAGIAHLTIGARGRRVAWTALESGATISAVPIDRARVPGAATSTVLVDDIGWRAGFPAPSAKGRLAFMGSRDGAANAIYLLDAAGRPKQLTTDAPNHGGPFWLAGDHGIASIADHGDGASYWAVDPDTGRERRLFRLDALRPPPSEEPFTAAPAAGIALTADVSRLAMAFVRDGVPNVWTLSLGVRGPTGVFVQRTFEKEGGSYASWSPDGRALAYQCSEGPDLHVCLVGEQPGDRRQLTTSAGLDFIGGWSPDGEEILFAARRQAVWNVAAVSASTGAVRILTTFTLPRSYVRYPRWDAANQRVVFERFEVTARPWSVELPR